VNAGCRDEAVALPVVVIAKQGADVTESELARGSRFDQAGLHGVLERIRFLALDLVVVRRVRGSPAGGDD
jgi:hypothetical protein